LLRDNLIEVLDSDYVRMAELKGLSAKRVLMRHALPNALVPTLNVTALNLAYLVGGVVVVEKCSPIRASAACWWIRCSCVTCR
jgi:peptide/nickel transport system permease protein